MRRCARMSCPAEPVATISLRYAERRIVIGGSGPNGIRACSTSAPAIWLR